MGRSRMVPAILVAFLVMALLPAAAAAESVRRTVGDYELAVNYAEDPAYLEDANAVTLEVRDARTGQPVVGLERTLSIEGRVIVGETERELHMAFRPDPDRPGYYEAVFVPPAIGEYRFHLTGAIHGTAVDETFASGPGGLPEVTEPGGLDYTEPGSVLAIVILVGYVIGVVAIVVGSFVRRRARAVRLNP